MSAPDHNIFSNEEYNHDWVCVDRAEVDSSPRPPVYNKDNCSHADLGSYADGQNSVPQPAASPAKGYQYASHGNTWHQPPPHSYASSTASVPCPEGLEHEGPNLAVANSFLPLGPDAGLNEIPHRRSASFKSDMSYQMRRFLVEQNKDQPQRSGSPAQDKFLPQDIYIQSSKNKIKDKKRSKPSDQSYTSYSSEDQVFVGWGVEPTAYTGEWVDDARFGYCRDGFGYSSTLSGMTDDLNGE